MDATGLLLVPTRQGILVYLHGRSDQMSARKRYLQACLALERSSFQKLRSLSPTVVESGESELTQLVVPCLQEAPASKPSWYAEFASLVEAGQATGILTNAMVHGSHGDFSTTPFSDLDCTLILSSAVFDDPATHARFRSWLKKFYILLYKIDPLQHHGPFYLWPSLMQGYANSILPLSVYEKSWAIEPVDFSVKMLRQEPPEHLPENQQQALCLQLCNNLLNSRRLLFRLGYNLFAMKRYLSYLMLVPAFYYTDIGTPVRKADSFALFENEFDEVSAIVRKASELRRNWPQIPSWFSSIRPLAQQHKLTRRGACLLLKSSRIQRVITNEIDPLVRDLHDALERQLCSR